LICRRYLVIGKVQGVFFRQSTAKVANELGISGWCRNLTDGSVEVCACGDEATLNQLHAWLLKGPRAARVSKVESYLVDVEAPHGFTIRHE
jgi:acylphosphatase